MTDHSWQTAVTVLRLAGQLVDGVQAALARRGCDDIRPAHGFAFVRIAGGDATTPDVAVHLGITKQAAAQLVGYPVGEIDERGRSTRWGGSVSFWPPGRPVH